MLSSPIMSRLYEACLCVVMVSPPLTAPLPNLGTSINGLPRVLRAQFKIGVNLPPPACRGVPDGVLTRD